ncbi:rho GTPase-activating protein 25 [Biomphalaria glabrata]|uniref:Rho GTPase-activating protein 25-like n=1 Tax=Biomphalaria glabrata TaxID=6526 RepID=A0A9W2ZP19_BIOGL|nr:rho GTPase-activating protein 25-like [Biomphalaria glabrata]XP_055876795.1 rho GTPase-activating protein 25-like [Biomphalaria glabrata]XP_055876796.1 rho GTPase-activating protein 25-like [Biomphalaria glabrata]XP_055876797.1 rho GTPase-activating protein 25-like [Biomphalaria glabrata]XP_055876798.1 rho GTPase-activating protein 25-like [Biomphalaria glabrata]XP_055876799.1 rho GTPase-activating protein 25-like [Biomphalaria glabrata]KAI8765238.1 rho GTPase-activating protein 25-like [B
MTYYPKDKPLRGWLKRKGGRMNSWSRRWCILSDKFLFFYLKEDDKKHSDCISLEDQTITEPGPDPNSVEPRRYQFDIVCGQNEISLCADSEELKKVWTRALKKALYANKGGALFSQSLEEILMYERRENRIIPYIVDECVEFLYKYGLEAEGIFRLPGRQSAIKEIILRFDKGEKIKLEDENVDVHVVASVLKTFLRDLPDSIIPCRFFQKFMNIAMKFMEATDYETRDKCVSELAEGMKSIPKDNYIILKYVCRFLREVGLREPINKMSMMSIGTVFGYNLIRHIDKENSHLLMCTADLGQNLVFMLLEYFPIIFKLEYSDKGEVGNVVPTEDLLRMSRHIDAQLLSPNNVIPKALKELEGVDFSLASPVTPDSCKSSMISLNIQEESTAVTSRNVFFNSSSDLLEIKRTLHLSLSDSSETGNSQISPVSPSNDPPVPPKRKSRLQRNRFASEKVKPSGAYQLVNDISLTVQGTRGTILPPDSSEEKVSEQEVITSNSKGSLAVMNRGFSDDTASHEANGNGKLGPSHSDLRLQVSVLKEELSIQRDKSKKQVNALKDQLVVMKERYEHRIDTMQNEYNCHQMELETNLEAQRQACAAAIAENMKLKERLHLYEMKYGVL